MPDDVGTPGSFGRIAGLPSYMRGFEKQEARLECRIAYNLSGSGRRGARASSQLSSLDVHTYEFGQSLELGRWASALRPSYRPIRPHQSLHPPSRGISCKCRLPTYVLVRTPGLCSFRMASARFRRRYSEGDPSFSQCTNSISTPCRQINGSRSLTMASASCTTRNDRP